MALNIYTKSQELLDAEGRRRVLEDMVRRQLGSLYPLTPVLNVGGAAMGTAPGITPPKPERPEFLVWKEQQCRHHSQRNDEMLNWQKKKVVHPSSLSTI